MLNRLRKEQEGLTLIELIVVVAIIGILAWLITPRVLEALNNSKVQSALSVATELQGAMERYATENDASYPVQYDSNSDGSLDANITQYDHLVSALGTHVTIAQNQEGNIDATEANGASFDYTVVNTPASGPPQFCFVLQANDRTETWIKIDQSGITTDPDNQLACP